MHVRMQLQGLPPGVQHRDDAEIPIPGLAGEGLQCFGGGAHERRVDRARVVLHQAVEGVGQGEDEMEVLNRQQLELSRIDPGAALGGAAFRAVAIAAGVVADLGVAAPVALIDMAAEGVGAAGLDGVQGTALLEARVVTGAVVVAVAAHDIGQLERGRLVVGREFAANLGRFVAAAHPCGIV
jgi:hypothetical protein